MATSFAALSVVPQTLRYDLLLTLSTPASHHDPAVQDDSNRQLFNRQKQLWRESAASALPTQEQIDALCQANPVPGDVADIARDLSFPEYVACCLVRLFIDQYNSLEGQGLFSGMERYSRLEARARLAAISAPTLRAWWNRLCDTMQVGIHGGELDGALLALLTVPSGLQQMVLRVLTRDYRSVISLARLWHSTAKLQSDNYALKVNQDVAAPSVVLSWLESDCTSSAGEATVIDVPTVSGNSLRHQVVREPSWQHLCDHLGLDEATPGQGPVPAGVEAIFYNGGNISAGAKQPSNTHALAQLIRQHYPSLDLLGGVTDSFDLGESRLELARAQRYFDAMRVRAPIDGMVVRLTIHRNHQNVQIEEGDQVGAGQPYLRIVDLGRMIVNAQVNQTDAHHLRLGTPALVRFDAYPGLELPARVMALGTFAVTGGWRTSWVRHVPVSLELERTDERVVPDLSVSADLILERIEDAAIVPREAVFQEPDSSFVLARASAGEWEKRDVEVVLSNNVEVAVRSGVSPGETVAAELPAGFALP